MITSKLTAVMAAFTVTLLAAGGSTAAFAQATNANLVGDLTNALNIETGGNTQVNAAETTQNAENNIEISNEAESGDAEAEGGDAEAEAEAEAESEASSSSSDSKKKHDDKKKDGDKKSSRGGSGSNSEAEADADAIAVGGDADATSGDALAVQVVEGNTFDQSVDQDSTTTQVNALEDNDDVTAIQANVPIQLQVAPIAADVDIEAILANAGVV